MHKNNIIKLLNLQVKSLNLKDFFIASSEKVNASTLRSNGFYSYNYS